MTIHLDTSVLVDALTGPRRSFRALERAVAAGHVIAMTTWALYEWLRGPRTSEELADQEALLPTESARQLGRRKREGRPYSTAASNVGVAATWTWPSLPARSRTEHVSGR